MSIEDLYKHFGLDRSLIPLQKQVSTDVYNILERLGFRPQTPCNVAISTRDGLHRIVNYPFDNIEPRNWGRYPYSIDLEVKVDYNFDELRELVEEKVRAIVK